MKILFLAPYPFDQAPSQRFRFEMMLPLLSAEGVTYDFVPFLSPRGWAILYQRGKPLQKLWAILLGFGRRKLWMLKARKYDLVFIHREAAPLGPPFFEWWLAKVLQKKIIFDFDDAIWLPNTSEENHIAAALKWHGKTKSICRWAWKVSAGNDYLADFAKQYCDQVVVLPTVVDTAVHCTLPVQRRDSAHSDPPVIGWTGSHSTLPYLREIIPAFQQLEDQMDFTFLVIANKDPELPLKNYQFIQWSKETEIEDLRQMDIGVMPLPDNQWAQGKCGFKLIQYLAMEIPAVASPVGVNKKVLKHEVSGYFACRKEEWVNFLQALCENKTQREQMGQKGRSFIESNYSLLSQKKKFLRLFNDR